MIEKKLGTVTAYAYAVKGGYTGTEEEFTELLGNIAIDLSEIENLTVTANTLPAGSSATASYSNGVLTLGIPRGEKGETGATGPQGEKGETGATGPQGEKGADYVLTASDKTEIANIVIGELPTWTGGEY